MAPIRVLPDELKNQIAAGEVIERPSSVVKELVENSLDAGARRVTVEVAGGGIDLVRVLDNGGGIAGEEIPLAFARHATSKLAEAGDLWRLTTLGFRGEALPSIAAVARVRLFSRVPDAATGRRVEFDEGRAVANEEEGGPVGTEVVVEGLFANVPARLKYLRNKAAEAGRITGLMTALALTRPEVAFRYVRDGREVFATPGRGDPLGAIQAVYGLEVAEELLAATATGAGIAVEGYVSRPGLWRSNRWQEVFALNGRVVENRVLSVSLERAYGQLLPAKHYPIAVLYLSVEPTLVDVNVHPAKKEVRFAREDDIWRAVYRAVDAALTGKGIELRAPAAYSKAPAPKVGTQPQARLEVRPVAREVRPGALLETPPLELVVMESAPGAASGVGAATPPGSFCLGGITSDDGRPYGAGNARQGQAETAPEFWAAPDALRYVGQVLRTYLVFAADDRIVLVDQHAAHERVIYEALKSRGAPLVAQQLLAPEPVELSPLEWEAYRQVAGALCDMGFDLAEFGTRSVLLRAVPLVLGRVKRGSDLREIVAELAADGGGGRADGGGGDGHNRMPGDAGRQEALIRIACKKGAVKAGEELQPTQAHALFAELANCQVPSACPHGRPTALVLDGRWLTRAFGREG